MVKHVQLLAVLVLLLGITLPDIVLRTVPVQELVQGLWLVVCFLELAHLVELEVVIIFRGLQRLRVLVLIVAWVQTLLLRHELHLFLGVCLLLLLAKEDLHSFLQLVDLVYFHLAAVLVDTAGDERVTPRLREDGFVDKVDQVHGRAGHAARAGRTARPFRRAAAVNAMVVS